MDPIRQKMMMLLKDPDSLDTLLQKGAERARALAQQNMKEIKDIVGFLS